MITVRKLKLTILNDNEEERAEQYKFIRDSQYAQYRALNIGMSFMWAQYELYRDLKSEEYKEAIKSFKYNLNNTRFADLKIGKGIDTLSAVSQKVKKDFSATLKNGVAKGDRAVNNYKRDFPLITRGRDLKFKYSDNDEIVINWVNKIKFKVVIGRNDKDKIEVNHTLNKIINNEYKVNQSSIAFDKKNNLILNLTLDIPSNEEYIFVKDRALGVDMGMAVPCYASVSDQDYIKKGFGTYEEITKVRTSFRSEKRRLQSALQYSKGGKGRKKKLKALERFRAKERNFAKTYNHTLSSNIVNFARVNKCEYINLEKLTKNGFDNRLLGLWGYYELQNMIEYKAERQCIKIRLVEASYTSQTCSQCGHIDKDNRQAQSKFVCLNCSFTANADYNASMNIAKKNC